MNQYLAKKEALRVANGIAAQEMERQYCYDQLGILLHEKHGFTGEQLMELFTEREEMRYRDLNMFDPDYVEADVKREHYDRDLEQIYGGIVPFEERYPHAKKIRYDRSRKSWK